MAFGDSAQKMAETASQKSTSNTVPPYLQIKNGETIFRLFPEENEVQWREFWLEVPVTRKVDDKETTKNENRSLILSVLNPETGYFDSAEKGTQDPLSEWYYDLTEGERKALGTYIRTRFAVNVLNRNLVTKNGDEVVPDENGEPWNVVQILSHSGGKKGGKHRLQDITDCISSMRNSKGKSIKPWESDIRIVRGGEGLGTRYSVYQGFNQDPVDFSEYTDDLFLLEEFYKPFPFEAIEALRNGAEWNETLDRYDIKRFPSRRVTATNQPDEDLPF
jgi:hypothetical protein